MGIRTAAFLVSMALAGLFSLPAFAGDGDKDKPSGGAKEAPKGEAKGKEGAPIDKGGCCKEKEKECGECAGGTEAIPAECPEKTGDGKECCKDKAARTDLEVVTLALVEGTCEAAKKALAAVPAASLEKVEAARKAALEKLAAVQAAMCDLKKEFDGACAEAKAKGAEVCCDMKATFEKDLKTLQGKAKEQVDLCAKVVMDSIGEAKVKELSADCRKAGDMAKAAGARVKALAAKLLERKKAAEAEEEEEDDEGDEADEAPEKGPEKVKEGKDAPEPKGKK